MDGPPKFDLKMKTPTLARGQKLARSIHPDDCGKKNRPKPSAYQRSNETYLSVNSLEVQTKKQVAQIYSERWFGGERPVAMTVLTTDIYCEAGRAVGCPIELDEDSRLWSFGGPDGREAAFKHRPKHGATPVDPSHSGVEFVCTFNDYQDFQFSMRLVHKATYSLV